MWLTAALDGAMVLYAVGIVLLFLLHTPLLALSSFGLGLWEPELLCPASNGHSAPIASNGQARCAICDVFQPAAAAEQAMAHLHLLMAG